MSTLIGAVVEVVATLALMALCGTVAGLVGLALLRLFPEGIRAWLRREWSSDLPPVRRGHESPVEVYRRKQLEQANEWQQVDR